MMMVLVWVMVVAARAQKEVVLCGGRVLAGAHYPERATSILFLCHSIFTDRVISGGGGESVSRSGGDGGGSCA